MSDRRVPLVVLGAGPAGVAAARAAIEARVAVVLIDLGARLGGQYHRREPEAFATSAPGALHHGWARWSEDVTHLERSPRFTHVAGAGVWAIQRLADGGMRIATDREDPPSFETDALIIATGANERVVPFPGWDLPGVLTVGGAQALLKGQGMRPGHAVVISGAWPLLLPVAAALARVRTNIVALTDANDPRRWLSGSPRGIPLSKVREGASHLATLARHGVRLRPRTAAIAAHGDGRLEAFACGLAEAHVDDERGVGAVLTPAGHRRVGLHVVQQVRLHVEDGRAVDEVASTQVQHVALHALELQGSWWQGWAAR